MKRSLKGFTLIELLVVIAIIAILAAILFPVFTQAKATSKKAACICNMRQICSAWASYVDDNSGLCPSVYNGSSHKCWMEELMPYVKSVNIFGCPASNIIPKRSDELKDDYCGYLSYGWNATLFNYADYFPVRQSDVYKTTTTVFMADTVGANWISLANKVGSGKGVNDYKFYQNAISWTHGTNLLPNGKKMSEDCCHLSDRHSGMIVVAFCDGHVGCLNEMELTKVQQGKGRKVAYLQQINGGYAGKWNSIPSLYIFPYFQVSASLAHF